MTEAVRLGSADAGLSHVKFRFDARRDTRITVQRNVDKHIYVAIGKGAEITMILHPHAAKRLIANIEAVLQGEEFATR